MSTGPKDFPSRYERIERWSQIYAAQGQRWGTFPSMTAHLALVEIDRLQKKRLKLIDIGCGYGRDLALFRSTFAKAILDGLEPSPSAIRAGESILPLLNLRNLYTQDVYSVAQDNALPSYDVVFANYFMHLFSLSEATQIMRQMSQMLRPGGIIVVSFVSVRDRHFGKGRRLSRRVYEVRNGIPWRFVDMKEVRAFCDAVNLQIHCLKEFSEVESTQQKPDPVEGIYLVAGNNCAPC